MINRNARIPRLSCTLNSQSLVHLDCGFYNDEFADRSSESLTMIFESGAALCESPKLVKLAQDDLLIVRFLKFILDLVLCKPLYTLIPGKLCTATYPIRFKQVTQTLHKIRCLGNFTAAVERVPSSKAGSHNRLQAFYGIPPPS